MQSTRYIRIAMTLWLAVAATAHAQTFPSKPIRVVTSDPGGGSDVIMRTIAPAMSTGLGQQVIIDNRAGGVIAGEFVSKSPPDGHTMIFYANTLWLLPLLQKGVPYDTVRDFLPVTHAMTTPNILVVHPSLPVKSVKELIALAKSRPGQLNYASAAMGTSNHIAAELFKSMAGVNIVRIGYKGIGAGIIDLVAGHVQMAFATSTSSAVHVKSGRLRPVAISTAKPSSSYPGLPTIAATIPGYESASIGGLLVPARTPEAVIQRLNAEAVRALKNPENQHRFDSLGAEVVASTPQQFAAVMKADMAAVSKLIKEGRINVE
jgi:tripartite-type tricarboxylate transporter receptor subunit TctC